MPRRQFVMMGVQYAPAAIRKTMAQRKILASGTRELRTGSCRSKTQLVVNGGRLPAGVAHHDPAHRRLWLAAWTAKQRDAEPVKDVWRAFWKTQPRPGTPDHPPSFAARGMPTTPEDAGTSAFAEQRGSDAAAATREGTASPAHKAVSSNSLFKFARLGIEPAVQAPSPNRTSASGGQADADALKALRKLAAAEGPRPAAKPTPSRSKLRKALLAYTAL